MNEKQASQSSPPMGLKETLEGSVDESIRGLHADMETRLQEIQDQLSQLSKSQERLEGIQDQLNNLVDAQQKQREFGEVPPLPTVNDASASKKEHVVERERITGTVDPVLFDLFHKERKARGVTVSRMLDIVLWKYYGKPQLSFEIIAD